MDPRLATFASASILGFAVSGIRCTAMPAADCFTINTAAASDILERQLRAAIDGLKALIGDVHVPA